MFTGGHTLNTDIANTVHLFKRRLTVSKRFPISPKFVLHHFFYPPVSHFKCLVSVQPLPEVRNRRLARKMIKRLCCKSRDTNHFPHPSQEKILTFGVDFICKIGSVLYKQCLNSSVINVRAGAVKPPFLHKAVMEMAVSGNESD